MDQIIDIATDGRHLARDRGFLKVSEDGVEIGRTPLDQIAGVIVHAHGITWSGSLLTSLAELGVPVVLCGPNHALRAVITPLEGHHEQSARIRAQWQAKASLVKQAWKQIVIAKIRMQATALAAVGAPPDPVLMLARKVGSGDGGNVEAQAARRYWPLMMGSEFRRDTGRRDVNALLNYGYTVLRAATARAVTAAGLHPSIGLHHSNRGNAFALADDLMEPFRPLVDVAVRNISHDRGASVDGEAKRALARLIAVDVPLAGSMSPISLSLVKLAASLGQSFVSETLSLALPGAPDPLALSGLGR
ncbi:type II CRISPR-associated endonuclease Cas1 [Pikeienuella sp. HZG-20]|uniref:type II CRISPR-associated endonuclease Cas1 n=1 Tax=Paludibacillus litoralis TaxID=3133267 RepID=UPI0030EDE1B1